MQAAIATSIVSAPTDRSPRRNGSRLSGILSLAAAILLGATVWLSLRAAVAERLTIAAQRDLQTIVDLAAVGLEQSAPAAAGLTGGALLTHAVAANPEFARALARAEDENHRHIYFFGADGRTVTIDETPADAAAPAIVRSALAGLDAGTPAQGMLFEPYADSRQVPVIGVWRWLPRHDLGIVAERPHARFAQPLRWIDGLFVAFALLAAGAYPWLARNGIGLGRLFRPGDAKTCGPYELGRQIGEGAMAKVYLARHRDLGRWVALKRLRRHAMTDELSARFDREARLASRLSHPNIVTVFDHGPTPDGGFYYAMEYVRGLTLTQWVEEHGPVPPARTVRILQQLCAAVGELHRHQLLHRDIKPDNIVAYAAHGDYDLIKLLDFGLIKDMGNDASRDLTRDVRVLGTPAFMAPERLLNPAAVDSRSDIYGIGCIGFYLLTGRKPFESARDADLAQQVMHVAAPDVAGLSIFPLPAALVQLIAAALDKDVERRPADTDCFARALDAVAAAEPWRRERAKLWWQSVQGDDEGPAGAAAFSGKDRTD